MRSKYMQAVLHCDVGYFDLHVTSTSEVLTSISNDIQFNRISKKEKRRMHQGWNAGSIAEQAISSSRSVYAFTGENNTIYQFSEALRGTIKLGLKQGMIKGLAIGSSTGTALANWAACLIMGNGCCFIEYSNLKYIAEACSAGDHILEIINRVPEIDLDNMEGAILEHVTSKRLKKKSGQGTTPTTAPRGAGTPVQSHVQKRLFAHQLVLEPNNPSRPENIILNRFCLTVRAGKTVVLVGSSGSGKSIVISLLQRFYDPLEGEILLNGVAIDKLQLKWLRSQINVIRKPRAFIVLTTIKDNTLLGEEDGTREEIVEAAKASNAHDFICQLPQGYDTQRIAIARALIKKPHILLLDEATSAVDSESERLVQEALHRAAMGRTTIVIAHRLSTIRNADLIGVMQNGCVIETGSHDELIQHQNGLYTSFVRLQQTETETPEDQFQCTGTCTTTLPVIASPLNLTSQLGGSDSTTAKEYPNNMVTRKSSIWRLLSITSPKWKQAILGRLSAMLKDIDIMCASTN
ncbi:putative xenobiotic-transporting ATPase [Rosa chinensis]|uniref:Putative xenobiotic-transporting ATPase n=1 Tax=Rosa chinensis TaxID=74649 RepID=A0A2P6S4Y4_ROSCH|nr:putative xenobiotic-transporting ATPase [Rosa chinensis]